MENVPTHQDEGIPEEGYHILVHVETKEDGPVLSNLFQPEVIGEIIKGCLEKYPTSVEVLNEYECVITMTNKMIASTIAKDLESRNNGEVSIAISNVPLFLGVNLDQW